MKSQGLVRIKRQIVIHNVVQVFLIGLLFFVAWKFQQVYAEKMALNLFFNSIFITLGLQLLLFYPIYRFAGNDARGEIAAQRATKPEVMKALRQKRIFSDFIKAAIFIFYATFIVLSPEVILVISTTFFSFIATTLTYLQCFNFIAKKSISLI